jgi:Na+-translocating ferredoxin:NAD+ oxidoreductase RnfG subunit
MNNLVDEILEILKTHALVKTTRVVHYDETPGGKLEVKISDWMKSQA